ASEKAISLNPDLSEGYKALGLAYLGKGRHRKSIETNQKAVELNPNNEQAVGNMGWCYFYLGEFDKAMHWSNKQLEIAPSLSYSYYLQGMIYLGLDDSAKAEQWLNKALELQPDFFGAMLGLINCYLAQGKYQKAIEQSQKWLSMAPNSPLALNRAGDSELFSGNYNQAQHYYQKSIEIKPTIFNLTTLGYIYWRKEQEEEARKLFDQSLSLCQEQLEKGNESPSIPYSIASINAVQDNKGEAYKWLKKAIDAGWRDFRFGERYPLLENLHKDDQFKQMMAQVKEMVDEMRKRIEENN
ncbi:MAG: tetratricopeptide repeat protein, partial [Desulfobacteraceae bacterium]|nr:tetratricopeptide repeat protein [Desulfobacteraceae bacterium]